MVSSITATEITKIFERFELGTQEQRDKILSQGNSTITQPETVKVTTWFSKGTNDSRERDVNFAKLENTSR